MIIIMSLGTFFTILAIVAVFDGLKNLNLRSPKFWIGVSIVSAFCGWIAYGIYENDQKEKLAKQERAKYLLSIGAIEEFKIYRDIEKNHKDKNGEIVSKSTERVGDITVRIYSDSLTILVPEKLDFRCELTFNQEVKIKKKNEFTRYPKYKCTYLGEIDGIHHYRLLSSELPHAESLELEWFDIKWNDEIGDGEVIGSSDEKFEAIQEFYKMDD